MSCDTSPIGSLLVVFPTMTPKQFDDCPCDADAEYPPLNVVMLITPPFADSTPLDGSKIMVFEVGEPVVWKLSAYCPKFAK